MAWGKPGRNVVLWRTDCWCCEKKKYYMLFSETPIFLKAMEERRAKSEVETEGNDKMHTSYLCERWGCVNVHLFDRVVCVVQLQSPCEKFLLGNYSHEANPQVHQQHIVWAMMFRSGLPQPLSSQTAKREQKPTNIELLFFASRTNWNIYVVRRGVDARLKLFLGVWMRVGNYETSWETARWQGNELRNGRVTRKRAKEGVGT